MILNTCWFQTGRFGGLGQTKTLLYQLEMRRQQSSQTAQSQTKLPPAIFGENFLYKIGWHPACLTVPEEAKKSGAEGSVLHRKWWLYTPASTLNHMCLGGKRAQTLLSNFCSLFLRNCYKNCVTAIFAWSIFNPPLSSLHVRHSCPEHLHWSPSDVADVHRAWWFRPRPIGQLETSQSHSH